MISFPPTRFSRKNADTPGRLFPPGATRSAPTKQRLPGVRTKRATKESSFRSFGAERRFVSVLLWRAAVYASAGVLWASTVEAQVFTDVSRPLGIPVNQPSFGNPIWTDFNNDGILDLYVGNHGQAPTLLKGRPGGTFADLGASDVGILPIKGDRHGAAWADYDNDGDLDLFITLGGGKGQTVGSKSDQLFRNNNDGTFTDVTASAGVTNTFGRGRSPSWVDVDRDGWLDLYLENFETPNVLLHNNGDGTFTDISSISGLASAAGSVIAWGDYNNDGNQDVAVTNSTAGDQLWLNNGNSTFTNVSKAAGFVAQKTNGQSLAWGDYDNDGNLDLFISRGYDDQNNYDWDKSRIRFRHDVSKDAGIDFVTTGNNVRFNLYIAPCRKPASVFIGSNRSHPASIPFVLSSASGQPNYVSGQELGFFIWKDASGWHLRWSSKGVTNTFTGDITSDGSFTQVVPLRVNRAKSGGVLPTLYRNNGNGTFTDVAAAAGMVADNTRAAVWGDYDNDGLLDLYAVSAGSLLSGNGANHLYHNNGNGTFTDVAASKGAQAIVDGRGDGAAFGDYDGDGALDLYITNGANLATIPRSEADCLTHGPHVLLRNGGSAHHWLVLRLRGVTSNRDAFGARVQLQAGGIVQRRDVGGYGGGSEFSQGSGRLVQFGLGTATIADSITINWPSGRTQKLVAQGVDQVIEVVEPRQ